MTPGRLDSPRKETQMYHHRTISPRLAALGVRYADAPPPSAPRRGEKPNLAQFAASWQARLRLRDWRIDVSYVRGLRAPDGSPVYGLCSPHVDAKRAQIQINDPATPWGSDDPSVEETLVHELLHLHMAPLAGTSQAAIMCEENAVWALTEVITSGNTAEAGMVTRATRASHFASRRRTEGETMSPELIEAARKAVDANDKKAALEMLKSIILAAASGGGGAPGGGEGAAARARAQTRRPVAPTDQMLAEIDRRMGIQREVPDAITIDASGRLSVSHMGRLS